MIKSGVGIDVSMELFHACFQKKVNDGTAKIVATRSFKNTGEGFEELLRWTSKHNREGVDVAFVMEATGVYYENLSHFLYVHKQRVSVVLANKMKSYFKSLNIKTKTDKVDSKVIAMYGIERPVEEWEPMSECYKELRDLCRELLALKKDVQRAKNQLHAMEACHHKYNRILEIKASQIEFYEKAINEIRVEIKALIGKDAKLSEKLRKTVSIPGIGLETAAILVSETNGFLLFKNIRQLVSYAGMDVSHNESGNYKGRSRISKKGNNRIRQALYMPALSATRANILIKNLYQRVCEKNPGSKRKGIVAAMRKLLILVFTIWKKDRAYDKAYVWAS